MSVGLVAREDRCMRIIPRDLRHPVFTSAHVIYAGTVARRVEIHDISTSGALIRGAGVPLPGRAIEVMIAVGERCFCAAAEAVRIAWSDERGQAVGVKFEPLRLTQRLVLEETVAQMEQVRVVDGAAAIVADARVDEGARLCAAMRALGADVRRARTPIETFHAIAHGPADIIVVGDVRTARNATLASVLREEWTSTAVVTVDDDWEISTLAAALAPPGSPPARRETAACEARLAAF